jgi:hypothetical protein
MGGKVMTRHQPDRQLAAARARKSNLSGRARLLGALAGIALLAVGIASLPAVAASPDAGNWIGTWAASPQPVWERISLPRSTSPARCAIRRCARS